jgi:cytochrome c-type biogenesis protein
MGQLPFLGAFFAGLGSFFSPCILPLVPSYFCYLSGYSLEEIGKPGNLRKTVLWHTVFFVLGFSLVFVFLGVAVTLFGLGFGIWRANLRKIAGILLVLFGLNLLGIFQLPFLAKLGHFAPKRKPAGLLGSLFTGMALGLGWTPCVGAFLGAVLAYAASEKTLLQGAGLLFFYSLGLGAPFLLFAFALGWLLELLKKFQKFIRPLMVLSGIILTITGMLIFVGKF